MLTPRRFLPSLPLLSAFEAAARTGSLTVAGDGYVREIREALRRISTASLNLRANPSGGTLNLAILPTFGTRWLAPRLPDFLAAHPGISINFVTRSSRFDFRLEAIDAAIHFGPAEWPGAELAMLRPEIVIPACSPSFKDRFGFQGAADISNAPLLHMTSRPDAWEQWLLANGVDAHGVHGMLFDQFATAAQAAVAGLGVALLPDFLIREELRTGHLVPALDRPMRSDGCYHLAWPADRAAYPPLVAFRAWILAATLAERIADVVPG